VGSLTESGGRRANVLFSVPAAAKIEDLTLVPSGGKPIAVCSVPEIDIEPLMPGLGDGQPKAARQ